MAIQIGTNLLTGDSSGGSGTPINAYAAFDVNVDVTLLADSQGSVWLQTGRQLSIIGTGHIDDAQIYIDQGANVTGALTANSSFGTSGSVELAGFNSNFLGDSGAENRSPVFSWDGINNQFIIFNSVNNLTNLRYATMQPNGTFGSIVGENTGIGTAQLGGAVGDGSDFYAIYNTVCSQTQANEIHRVSGTYPYTSTTVAQTVDSGSLLAAPQGSRSLLVDEDYFYIFNNWFSPNNNDIVRISKATGERNDIILDDNYLAFFQNSGQTDTCWGILQKQAYDDGGADDEPTEASPHYIRQFRFTPNGMFPTGTDLRIDGAIRWSSPDSTYIGIDPTTVSVYSNEFGDTAFNLFVRQMHQAKIGDLEETYTHLRSNVIQPTTVGGNSHEYGIIKSLRNYIKIGNIEE